MGPACGTEPRQFEWRGWVWPGRGAGPYAAAMAQPEFVPRPAAARVRTYESPPREEEGWTADRPGELASPGQPRGGFLGNQGPDQGYMLKLAHQLLGRLVLSPGEDVEDVIAGLVAVATRRSSLFGRAPVIHDLTVAATVWGYLDASPDPTLEALRRSLFAELRHTVHYVERRRVASMVPDSVLALEPREVEAQHRTDWKKLLVTA